DVKKAYYGILQSRSGVQYAEEQVKLYQEMQRVTDDYVAQQTALTRDSLQVKSYLAKAEYDLLAAKNQMATLSEQMNLLLGRDIRTEFSVVDVPEETTYETDLEAAQKRALEIRPELQKARAKLSEAEFDRRIKKAE